MLQPKPSRSVVRCALVSLSVLTVALPAVVAADKDRSAATSCKVLIDADPGGDDSFALLWLQSLALQKRAEIVAVTTVGGNVAAEQTFTNANRILALGGLEQVEVSRSVPRSNAAPNAVYIHGDDGMGNLSQTLPASRRQWKQARAADDIIIEKLSTAPGEITLVAIGPLTNLAAAEEKHAGILAKAKELVVMGGAFNRPGNITPVAEFNIYSDPEAAVKVFASRNDVVVLPLNVTQHTTFTEEMAEAVRKAAPGSNAADFLAKLCGFLTETTLGYRDAAGVRGFHVHDAATLAYLFYPETLSMQRATVLVETGGQFTRGQTVIDQRHQAKSPPNAWVAMQVDAVNLLACMVEDLKVLCRTH
jgi:purine nucleosidase